MYYRTYPYYYYLCHGGPGSGRYPEGSGKRPYQHRGIKAFIRRRAQKKQDAQYAKRRQAIIDQKRKELTAKANREKEKEEAIREGRASTVNKYKGELTNQELEYAIRRIELTAKLDSYASSEMDKNLKRLDNAFNKVKKVNDYSTTAINAIKNTKTIYDMLNGKFPGDNQQKEKTKKVN